MRDAVAVAKRALGLLDLTSLNDGDTEEDIRKLCGRARTPHGDVAAVCVWPRLTGLASGLLEGSGIKVAAVANFPEGGVDIDDAADTCRRIVGDGGDEVDAVFPYRAFLDGDTDTPARLVAACREASADSVLKVILETGCLPDAGSVGRASRIALENGADFIKTSTGKAPVSATPEAARAMLKAIRESGSKAGLKVSGGIRDTATAARYLDLADEAMGRDWATAGTFRFGASGLLDDLAAVLEGRDAVATGSGY